MHIINTVEVVNK